MKDKVKISYVHRSKKKPVVSKLAPFDFLDFFVINITNC